MSLLRVGGIICQTHALDPKVGSGNVSLHASVSNEGVSWAKLCTIEAGDAARQ